jgi:hypothetical protein
LENPSTSPGSAQDIETLLDDFRGLMDQAEASIRLAQRIAAADTVPEARSTADTWASIRFAESAADLASRSEDVGLRLWIPVRAAP